MAKDKKVTFTKAELITLAVTAIFVPFGVIISFVYLWRKLIPNKVNKTEEEERGK